MSDDSILVFEYFTASGIKDKSIVSEAISMIKSLVDDLKNLNISLLISRQYNEYFKDMDITIINLDGPLDNWINNNSYKFDSAIFIADEGDDHLFDLTQLLEDNNIKLYCSNSLSVAKSSNKLITDKFLKNKVKQPKTYELYTGFEFKESVLDLLEKFNGKIIIKPLCGADCENVSLISSIDDIDNYIKSNPKSVVLAQEYVLGDSCSVSLLSDGVNSFPLSLNKQDIILDKNNNVYNGGMLPYEHPLKDKAFEVAVTAVNTIKGLKGFVGVDLILGEDDVTFIEINSRFTTPYIGLKQISNINIGETIFKLLDGRINIRELDKSFNLTGKIEFFKENNKLVIK